MSELARRAVAGSTLSYLASFWNVVLGVARSLILARLVAPEAFGWVALATIGVQVKEQLLQAGLHQAILSRPCRDRQPYPTYLSLVLVCESAGLALLLLAGALVGQFFPQQTLLPALLALLGLASFVAGLAAVPTTLLQQDLHFRRLAGIDAMAATATTALSLTLAFQGWGVWALVGERVAESLSRLLLAWGPSGLGKPRLGWQAATRAEIWSYCRRFWPGQGLRLILEYFDDLWISLSLGPARLGFYSKAYEIGRYPRRGLAYPLLPVLAPVFSRLQSDREGLSQAVRASLRLVVYASGFASGLLALIMPEVITYLLGSQWEPMLLPLRLLLGYMLLDSVLVVLVTLFFSIGRPEVVTRFRLLQAIFFIPAVIGATRVWGIAGTAGAATAMRALGLLLANGRLAQVVDISLGRLLLRPFLILAGSLAAGVALEPISAPGKVVAFVLGFGALLIALEGRNAKRQLGQLRQLLHSPGAKE